MELTDAGRALIETMPSDIGADGYPLPVDIQAAKEAVKAAKQPAQDVQAADPTKPPTRLSKPRLIACIAVQPKRLK